MLLVRMVSKFSRWDGSTPVNRQNASIWGDAVTDLKTTKNCLSTWLANTDEDINDAIVALALSRDKVQKMFYMILDETKLTNMEIENVVSLGEGPGLDKEILKTKHRDLVELDVDHLVKLSEYMISLANSPEVEKWTKTEDEIKTLLEQYRSANKIKVSKMRKQLRDDLGWL